MNIESYGHEMKSKTYMPWARQVQEEAISFAVQLFWEAQLLDVALLCSDDVTHACK